MTRVRRVSAALCIVVFVAGCNVSTRFDITMHGDGSGALRTTITLDADAVQRMGGAASLARTVPLGDLRAAGWKISPWKRGEAGAQTITLSHLFTDQADLARRVVDLVGAHGILRNPTLIHERGWFSSRDALSVVVDVRSPSIDIVHDARLAAGLRAAGVDPALLQARISTQLRSALHVSVVERLPGGRTRTYDAGAGSVETVRLADGGTDWDHVVKFGIGVALAVLAVFFFLAAGVGARRNRRRASQRVGPLETADREPLM